MLDFLQKHEGLEGHEVNKGYEGQESHGTWHIINYNVGASRGPLYAFFWSSLSLFEYLSINTISGFLL